MVPLTIDSSLMASVLIGLFSTLIFLVVRSYLTTFSFWRKRGVKGPTPWPFFGNSLELIFGVGDQIDIRDGKKYGKVFGIFQGQKPVLIVNDPEILEKIYIKNFSQFMDHIDFSSPDPMDMNHVLSGLW